MTTTNEIWHGKSEVLGHDLPPNITCYVEDPPYGVNFRSRRAQTPQGKRFVRDIENDADLVGAVELFFEVNQVVLPHAAEDAELYIFTRWDIVDTWIGVAKSLDPWGFKYKMMLVWDKGIPGMGDIDANWGCGHEIILYCKKGRRDIPERRSSIIAVDKVPNSQHIHPTEKPVALIEKLIAMSTNEGDWVVDPFSGSGSTSVAAMHLGRNSIGIEMDEQYIGPSRARLEQNVMDFG